MQIRLKQPSSLHRPLVQLGIFSPPFGLRLVVLVVLVVLLVLVLLLLLVLLVRVLVLVVLISPVNAFLPVKKEINFDVCSPQMLVSKF